MAYTPDPHLTFSLPPAVDGHLTFGADEVPVSATATCNAVVKLPALRVSAHLSYDNQVQRGPQACIALPVQTATQRSRGVAQPLQVSSMRSSQADGAVSVAVPLSRMSAPVLSQMSSARATLATRIRPATGLDRSVCAVVQAGVRYVVDRMVRWQAASAITNNTELSWQAMYRRQMVSAARYQKTQPLAAQLHLPNHPGRSATSVLAERYQQAWPPSPGKSWRDPGIVPPASSCYEKSAHITFKWPSATDGHLTFVCDNALAPGEPKRIIPIRSAYIVINNVTLIRVDTGRELVCEALDIAVDADSWTSSWSATLAWSEYNALRAERGQPVELLASLNGHSYKLLMEGAPARQRSFGKWGVSIRGRGIAAALDSPYQDVSVRSNPSQAMTAQQIMADALTINGVSNGWVLDWQITDWLVPAGAWSHQGTPIAAVLEVASAVGAIVQAADASKTLRILPRYPIKPWTWSSANPDIQIPLDVMATDSIEPTLKPAYNGVYVGGQAYGITALVKRQGTAGDLLAPTITHPLLTAPEATLQRGLAILGDTGAQERIGMSLPLSDDTGLIRLNMLADVPDPDSPWRGLVRGVALSAKWQDQGGLTVWQNISLERHYAN